MGLQVKKGDNVLVLAGKDKGKTGKIIAAAPSANKVIIDGVNMLTKHKKARKAQDKSEIVTVPGALNASNVQIVCPVCGKATRVAMKIEDGKKERTCKKCGASLDVKAEKKDKKKAVKAEETPVKEAPKKAKKSTAKESAPIEVEAVSEEKPVKKTKAKKSAEKSDK